MVKHLGDAEIREGERKEGLAEREETGLSVDNKDN